MRQHQCAYLDLALVKPAQDALPRDQCGVVGNPVARGEQHDALKQIFQPLGRCIGAVAVIHVDDHRRAALAALAALQSLHGGAQVLHQSGLAQAGTQTLGPKHCRTGGQHHFIRRERHHVHRLRHHAHYKAHAGPLRFDELIVVDA